MVQGTGIKVACACQCEHRRTGTSGLGGAGGGGGDVLARKNYPMPERVGIETGMQTETFIMFSCNETAIVGKIVQLKVCILNSINSLNVTLKNVLKEKVLPSMALSENVNHLVHTVDNDLSPKFFTFCPRSSQRIERTSMRNLKTNLHVNS